MYWPTPCCLHPSWGNICCCGLALVAYIRSSFRSFRSYIFRVVGMEGDRSAAPSLKKRRVGGDLSKEELLASWTRCHCYLPQKRRFCNLTPAPGSDFCGTHRPPEESLPDRVQRLAGEREEASRIPCPVDPSHTIYKFNLEAHLKICNASKHAAELQSMPYFSLNCNSGFNQLETPAPEISPEDLAAKVERVYLDEVLPCLELKFEAIECGHIEDKCVARLAKTQTSFQRLRHVKQDALIIAQLEQNKLFSPDTHGTFIELGAGKGKLGVSIAAVAPNARVVFVEREGQRRKADRPSDEDARRFTRIRRSASSLHIDIMRGVGMDIRHCRVGLLPANDDKSSSPSPVVVAKHLCGAATDLALRAVTSSASGKRVAGVGIATCCHHACSWEDYCGAEWMVEKGFSGHEFELLKYWTGEPLLSIFL